MKVQLRPELERFVQESVKTGEFASTEEVIEAGLARLMIDPLPALDEQTLAALQEAEAEGERGELQPWEQLRAELLAKYFPR